MTEFTLRIDFQNYWHAGGGRGGGALVDAVAHRDASGLPTVPGRHLKGLLRDAMERASRWGWFDKRDQDVQQLVTLLFGERPEDLAESLRPESGCLRVGEATLPNDVATWLAHKDGADLKPRLFQPLYQTAVDHQSGTARTHSLRGIEAVIPLTLYSAIEVIPGREAPPKWPELLRQVLPLIDALGAYRTRGLGRALLSLEENP